MNEIVTIYKINCYAALDPARMGESCSLLPWDDSDPGSRGDDDGGRDYVLPEHYTHRVGDDGLPAIFGESGNRCELMLHNGCPLLVDSEKRRAHLLEPVKKMASFRTAAGLTRAELAERLNVTQKEVYEWENLEREPDEDTLRHIAEILGCSTSDFR
jgi:DNA-binding XRE family transcriptional regulator